MIHETSVHRFIRTTAGYLGLADAQLDPNARLLSGDTAGASEHSQSRPQHGSRHAPEPWAFPTGKRPEIYPERIRRDRA